MGFVNDSTGIGLAILLGFITFGIGNVFGTTVSTEDGAVEGIVVPLQKGNVYQFKKIPYAMPPVGPLRFSKPVKHPPWNNTLNATDFGPACIPSGSSTHPISEDCLFLNVYIPHEVSTTTNKSVMVWIHGGGYIYGTGMDYDGASLAIHGDVIVVTINYRLGVFGFLSTGDSAARGNYGLWDQIEALKWIKSNIKYFGGNPDSITLFGESAGAFSISHLAIFPENKGLFHRVIMQSGSLGSYGTITKDPVKIARSLGSYLQCSDIQNSESLVACLRRITASDLNQASDISHMYSIFRNTLGLSLGYSPVIDGEMILGDPMSIFKNQSSEHFKFYQSLDVISGCTSAEGSLMLIYISLFPGLSLPTIDISEGIPTSVLKMFAKPFIELYHNNDTRILEPIYAKYTSEDNEEQGRLLVNLLSDSQFYAPMLESLLVHDLNGNSKSKTFQYFFSKTSPIDGLIGVPPKWFEGAGHAAEIPYIFYNEYLDGSHKNLSTEMMSYWTNFARYGDPNMGLPVPLWPEFTKTMRQYVNLNTEITTGSDLLGDRIRFWNEQIPRIMSETEIMINTSMGQIKGVLQKVKGKTINLFRQIPFAEPPTGTLRFMKPVPTSKWNGTLDATRFGPSCVQTIDPESVTYVPYTDISENCLFLNIYVPDTVRDTANKSVMVWIHGGGYVSGTGNTYDGTSLALQGDVIVVTLNYRLGLFGFLSTGDSNARGNYGLWDQIEALKWIKSNIRDFGGNSDSITLFGESAGAFSISHLAIIPENKGLFHRVIMQSGSLGSFGSVTKAPSTNARALGSRLLCNDVQNHFILVSCLRTIDALVLQREAETVYTFSTGGIFEIPLSPVIDGDLIPSNPLRLLENKSSEQFEFFQSLDVIFGCTSAEGSVFLPLLQYLPYFSLPAVNISEGIPSWVMKFVAQIYNEMYYNKDNRTLQAVIDKYISGNLEHQSRLFVNLMGDVAFYLPMLESLLLHNNDGNTHTNTFQYVFSHQQKYDLVLGVMPKWFDGAVHGAELIFLFDSTVYLDVDDRVLSTQMMSYWTNFANHGNPNIGLQVPHWPEFEETSRQYLDLDTNITVRSDLFGDRMDFWTEEIPRILSETNIIVTTPLGAIKGIVQKIKGKNVTLFRRIPFAEPPIGALRFTKPVPISMWNGTLDATQFGPSCIQTIYPGQETYFPNTDISEDCLFLNIYVPNEVTAAANKSVMVWIHGGAYQSEAGMIYDGSPLAIGGDVIIVTLNYRLGVFGFLSTGDSAARGNYGLWDQIEALRWIKSNIKYFGGNPDSITLFGESAGALSISHLAMIPENKGLFHRVIMQSGSLGTFGSVTKNPVIYARGLGNYLQCSDINTTLSLVSCLRGINSSALQIGSDVIYSAIPSIASTFEFKISPVIDGELIPSDPVSLLRNDSSEQFAFYQSLDVISGCTSAEATGLFTLIPLFPILSLPSIDVSEGIPSWAVKIFAESLTEVSYGNDTRILQRILDKYTSTDIEEQGRLLVNFLGDIQFYMPMLEALLAHDRGGNEKSNTFQYFFSQEQSIDIVYGALPTWFEGAGHGSEILYLFDSNGYLQGEDRVLSTYMMSYWTNFAKYGTPNVGLPVPHWPEYDETLRQYVDLKTNITTKSDLLGDRMKLWSEDIPRIMSETEIVISTQMGSIKGIVQNVKGVNISQFRKIPFAEPPTGQLRFSKPVGISAWTGTLDATRFGPSCIQAISPGWEINPNRTISEDCLFLNIYVPNEVTITANKSVMVWIHGGGYTSGSGMSYDGASLALHGDVIVVTVNYRLGVFGYLSTGDSSARGNYGLWDQIEALKWVKANIRYFGGNPDSVTLFGESAGAFSISHLAIIPQNKGLFHRVIMQSGSLNSFGSVVRDPLTYARGMGVHLRCSDIDNTASLVSCLRGVNSSTLQSGVEVVYSGFYSLGSNIAFALSPVIDGELIPSDLKSLLQNQSSEQFEFYQSLDIISGCNSAEGSLFVSLIKYFPYLSLPAVNVSDGIPTWVLKMFADSLTEVYYNNNTRILQPIYDKYTSTDIEEQGRLLLNLLGDVFFYLPMMESLLIHDKGGNSKANTFQYFFSTQPDIDPIIGVPPKWFKGAGHFAEVNYLFENWGYLKGDDRILSKDMMSYWTNFAKYGTPNVGLPVPHWPEYDETLRQYVDLKTNITTKSDLLGDRMKLWSEDIPRIMSETEIVISTQMGSIKGIVQNVKGVNISQFRKIPFAEPPTGQLRFSKPVGISAWTGTLDATRFGPSCIQAISPGWEINPNRTISEDCLFLNIYVPNEVTITANKSVMVWIHGGGYTSGSGMSYDGASLALHGDVIVVTVNYRLGVFGYLSTGDSSARGNYGLWDQIEALKWVKANIRDFGGNPDSVTLFGESAGAFSISHLAIIPQNKGLFHRVIMQSGSLNSFGSVTRDPLTYARGMGVHLRCSDIDNTESLVSCLRGVNSSTLQSGAEVLSSEFSSSFDSNFEFVLSPVIDGELIPSDLKSSLQNQSSEQFEFYQSLDIISGCNSAEGSLFVSLIQYFPYLSLPAVNVSDGIPTWVLKMFADSLTEVYYNKNTRILQPIYDKYTSTDIEEQGRLLLNLLGDVFFYLPMMESLLIHDKGGNSKANTFQYFFSTQPDIDPIIGVPPKWFKGAGHFAEVNYLFENWGYLKGDDRILSKDMMSYWTNFAKYGTPNVGLPVPHWPEYDETLRQYVDLKTNITTKSDLLGDRMKLWSEDIPRIMSETEIVISTQMGSIKGIVQNVKGVNISQFRKIPFAEPPTGQLRFSKPVGISAWTGTLDATRFGPSCIQAISPGWEINPNRTISEDCLFLNIYVPNEVTITANKSVMVWIHGGGYTSGSGMSYDGASLALHGDVIVVTVNYRLGVFGYLSTGDSSARGNYGLWDQIEALKWVKANIRDFGGNPDSVTLFGESAGAFSISHLAIIPQNKGIFHRVIMQSGSLNSFGSVTRDPLTYARGIGVHLRCSDIDNTESLVSCLRGVNSSTLQSGAEVLSSEFSSSFDSNFEFVLSPVIDGELIPSDLKSSLQNQSSEQFEFYQSLDIISGCNSAEGSLFVSLIQYFPYLSLPAVNVSDGIPTWVLKMFADSLTEVYYNNNTRILQPIYDKYTSTDIEEQGRLLLNLLGDVFFYLPMMESLLIHDKGGNSKANTFQYFFSTQPDIDPIIGVPPKWFKGAGHFAEVNYLFENWGYLKGDDRILSKDMMSYWTNFAKYGTPNVGLPVPHWPEYDETLRQYVDLKTNITTKSDLLGDRMKLWSEDIPRIMSETEIVISTQMGSIKGIVQNVKGVNISQFRKIPFAEPPTGQLRFSKPVGISAWTGTLDATRFGPSCIQAISPGWEINPNRTISEDCLFLNIYVPNEVTITANKSVMVWIHGGGYTSGSGMSYDGASLALHGDVIVVTVNYRLGVFGYLSTGDSSARGNYGLWDQIEALKWVKANIRDFGGNPDSVTLFGESAGAFSISHLAIIPQNKGLFHRVIMQSGSLNSFGSVTRDPLTYARGMGVHLRCSDIDNTESLVSCLRGVNSSTLQSGAEVLSSEFSSSFDSNFEFVLSPVIDGELIPSDLKSSLQNQSSEQFEFYQSLDIISGCNSAEGSLFVSLIQYFPYLSLPAVNVSDGIPTWVLKMFADSLTEVYYNNNTRILQPIYDKYTSTDIEEQGRLLLNLLGDVFFYLPMMESLLIHDKGGNSKANTFQYFFSTQPDIDPIIGVPPKWFKGAGHFAEVNYLFENWGYLKGDDRILSKDMMSYWTNFAKYGTPNVGLPVPHWPEYDETLRQYVDLKTNITTKSDLLGDRMKLWSEDIPRIMSETEIVISTQMGSIKGIVQNVKGVNISQFRKIPFAEPPTGQLRFSKPVGISAWTGTLDATRFGPSCIQAISPGWEINPNRTISEDCLFLNIYVPNEVTITANKSVMVWIHGGGYESGSGMSYDGASLALHGDVIVVTVNYRLGVFGYLSTGDSSARGNYGLWDQIEALKWVKANIRYFGGNPDSVTLFGESAGAFSISHLAIIPQNKGLFHRVIMQSGSLNSFGSVVRDPLTYARGMGVHLRCSDIDNTASLVSCLRGVNSSTLQSGVEVVYSGFYSLGSNIAFALSPVIDGELIPSDLKSLLQNQSSEQFEFYQSLDIISGCNSAEGSLFVSLIQYFPYLSVPAVNVSDGIPTWVLKMFADSLTEVYYNNNTRILQPIYDKYTSTDIEEQGRLLLNLLGDVFFYLPMMESLLIHDKGGNSKANTFQYFFSTQPDIDPIIGVPPKWFKGAGHFAEVNYLFENWGYLKGDDRILSKDMMSYWTNFAKYGTPNVGLPVPHWPEYDETLRQYVDLKTNITTKSDLLGDRMKLWSEDIPRIMSETEIVISTQMGSIKGIVQNVKGVNISQFRKIPFAEPPTGQLRFSKPVGISAWTGTLDATRFGPSCIQAISPGWEINPNRTISEDCLFLNIYVPNEVTITANKSVMVWIHGGGYESGSGMSYDGASLALHGDVIVVTVNYRLGVFGYLSTGDSSARGNYGLWDQIEALKWVKANIRDFGGNPDSVTLFGESAGAFSISHLAIIPQNKGLFHRVIMQSGSLNSFGSVTRDPLTYARGMGVHLRCSDIDNTESLVSCLRGVNSSTLQSGAEVLSSEFSSSFDSNFEFVLSPVIDGELIPSDLKSLLQNQSSEQFEFYQSLDIISGCNSAEGSLFVSLIQYFPYLSLPAVNVSDGIPTWVLKMFADSLTEVYYNNNTRILQPIYDKYTSTDIEEQGRLLLNLLGDVFFYLPMMESLLIHDKGGNSKANTFQYFFSTQPDIDPIIGVPPKWFKGAGHFAEVNYLFENWGYLKGDDRILSKDMMSYWTNFAKYGTPNVGLPVPHWPEYDETLRQYVDLKTNITTKSDLLGDRMKLWSEDIPRIMSETEIVISTQMGSIKGIVQNVKGVNISQFRKIPFAEPPTGQLRFSKPVGISAWTGTLDATRFGPSCIQAISPGWEINPNRTISEDCLFLNIYVPNEVTITANKSVMVWIHGGGYTSGSGMSYDGASLALHGDVIVVTVNYRLGVFGYLSTGDSSARGNYGLWDQIEALKWVKANIRDFGGNPDSVTLFGESAGAFSISHLAIIPQNKGLFHRVIMQSGSLNSFGSVTRDPLTYARGMGVHLRCSDIDNTESLVSCLRGVNSSTLQSGAEVLSSEFSSSFDSNFEFVLSPVIDGELIPSDLKSLLQNQSSEQFEFYQSLDIISGCNSAEGSLFVSLIQYFPYLSLPAVNVSDGIPTWVLKMFADSLTEVYYNKNTRILQPIYDKYTSTDIEEQGRLLLNLLGDVFFYLPMMESLLIHDKGGNSKANTFQYFFSTQPDIDPIIGVPPKWFKGAGHFAEVNYLFENWGYLKGDDRILSKDMMSYWTNFAKYGTPNVGLPVPHWPEYDETLRQYVDLKTNITTKSDLLGDRMKLWSEDIPRIMSETEIVISTQMGSIEGIVENVKGVNISQFRKIPFAEPPTGQLRFSKPVGISAWTGTLDATRFGPSCIQAISPGWEINPNRTISEDCLFLNIYVPNEVTITANKSVMVWIHGGGYTSGSGMSYDGASLALHGDVIVVTVNYRLGVFGYLSTGDSSARGNYGLWDQIEALKWVKANIRDFGGNPDSVTLFGESAGAFSISHLAIIPQNKGLFHRVIMQSGSLNSFGSVTRDPLTYARGMGVHLRCSDIDNTESLVSCLRGVNSSTLQSGAEVLSSEFSSSFDSNFEFVLSPVIDGELIPSDLKSLLQNQSSEQFEFYQSLDIISGCNSAEGSLFVSLIQYFPYLSLPAVNVSDGIPTWVLKMFADSLTEVYYNNNTRILQPIYDKYTSTDIEEQGRLLLNLLGDVFFYLPMMESLLIHDKGGNSKANTFQYFFSTQPDIDPIIGVPPKWFKGAGHFAEVNYLFENWGYLKGDDRILSKDMMSYWTNFAKYGTPNVGLPVPHWPEYDETLRQYVDLKTNITTKSDLLGDRMKLWSEDIPRIMSETEIVISTQMGSIKGIVQNVKGVNISQFRKIPFAEPPTGQLRFSKPVGISAWTGTLDATRFGPSCIQAISPGWEINPNRTISEDCLFLNIYVPNEVTITANKSVMVWIHGGGYTSGSGMSYDGASLALHGDVIVVTVNYRLGVFGYLSTGDSSARGNYGLWDQIEALKWVKANIRYFGGNPDSVTLFGESAGAFSISHLAIIPQNKGLFHRAIMQSGSLNSFGSVTRDPLTYARGMGVHLRCSDIDNTASLVSCLRGVNSSTLQSGAEVVSSEFSSSFDSNFEFVLSPVIDGELIPSDLKSSLQNQSSEQFEFYQSLDIISGCNSAEASVYVSLIQYFPYFSLPVVNVSDGIPTWVLKMFADSLTEIYYNNNTRILQPIYDKYSSTDIEEQGRLLLNLLGDVFFYLPMMESLLIHDKGGNSKANTFQYFFSSQPDIDPVIGVPPKWFKGAGHFAEVNYLFENWGYLKGDDRILSKDMMSYWTNFAKYGNPNLGIPVPFWPEFNQTTRQYIALDRNITTGSALLGDRMRFWIEEIPRIISDTNTVTTTLAPPTEISSASEKSASFVFVCLSVIMSLS